MVEFAERLAALLPDPLDTVFLVSTGSEANEVALRLLRAATGSRRRPRRAQRLPRVDHRHRRDLDLAWPTTRTAQTTVPRGCTSWSRPTPTVVRSAAPDAAAAYAADVDRAIG